MKLVWGFSTPFSKLEVNQLILLTNSMSVFSMIITIFVILSMTVAFILLFLLYSNSKRKVIELGGEDKELIEQMENDYQKYQEKCEASPTAADFVAHKKKQEKKFRVLTDVISGVIIFFILCFTCVALAFRIQGQQFYFGNTTLLSIQTGSMSEKNKEHKYYDELPNNQIQQFDMVGISKVEEADLKVYDIIAFKHDGVIYVHRIVQILETGGKRIYTTQGDANTGSFPFETEITFDQILGKYNGFHNQSLGVFLIYLQSEVGIIALVFAIILLVVIDLSETYIARCYRKRSEYLFRQLYGIESSE